MYNAFVAASRFGLGATPANGEDPKNWLHAQLRAVDKPNCLSGLDSSATLASRLEQYRQIRREAAKQEQASGAKTVDPLATQHNQDMKALYLAEVGARYQAALTSTTPFCERLVAFWSNHFTVSGIRPEVRPLAGAYEREAIRPHVLGRFEDMVRAVVMHPAMGLYLDNAISIGPNSIAGERQHRGVNENLGRELLELHTLGVDGGYTEEDVRALARILTGWSIAPLRSPMAGQFMFNDRTHEPGPQRVLGKIYAEDGQAQGDAVLIDICRHPSTARHIARQLATQFVSDHPPADTVERLAAVFRNSDGNLRQVSQALIDMHDTWDAYPQKVKDPWDLVVSASIATGIVLPPDQVASFLDRLGQPVYMAPQPSGWPTDAASWIGPESVLRRVEWCSVFAGHADPKADPVGIAERSFGDTLDPTAKDAIARAESRQTALAMLLASPQFQRR